MFRNGLVHARRILVSNQISFNFSPELCTSGYTAVYDVRRSTQDKDARHKLLLPADQSLLPSRHLILQGSQPLLPIRQTLPVRNPLLSSGCLLQDNLNLRLASTSFQMPNPAEIACNLINMTRCIDLNDLKDAPPPTFWVAMATVAAQLGFPFLELVGGYSPIMTYLQLYIAAAGLAWNGGQTWGLAMSQSPKPTASWDAMNMSLIPTGFAILGLLLPCPLGFLTIASGLVTSLYLDLKSCVYPPWAIAAKFLVVVSSTIGLLLALMAYVLFHNRENAKKKKNGKELPPAESDDQGEGDEKERK